MGYLYQSFRFTKSDRMKLDESFCCIFSKNDLVFCAFLHHIIFGKVENSEFKKNQYFQFSLNNICELFCAFFKIVKAYTQKDFKAEGQLCHHADCKYSWKLQNDNENIIIVFSIEVNGNSTLELSLSIIQFNDLVLLTSHMILPCLHLKNKETFVIQFILSLDLNQILSFKKKSLVSTFLKSHQAEFDLTSMEVYNIELIISYHLDVIVAINMMQSLYNQNLTITHTNIDKMLSCT